MSATAIRRPRVPPMIVNSSARPGRDHQHGVDARHLRRALGAACSLALAAAAGWAVGAVNGFVLNRAWTFRGAPRGAVPAARYAVVALAGSGLNAVLVAIAVSDQHLPRFAGELAVLPPVTALSFLLCRAWVFAQEVPA